jgi:hypothetical protein
MNTKFKTVWSWITITNAKSVPMDSPYPQMGQDVLSNPPLLEIQKIEFQIALNLKLKIMRNVIYALKDFIYKITIPNVSITPKISQGVMSTPRLMPIDVFSVQMSITEPHLFLLIINVEPEQIISKIVKDILELGINVLSVLLIIFSISIMNVAPLKLIIATNIIHLSEFCSVRIVLIPII